MRRSKAPDFVERRNAATDEMRRLMQRKLHCKSFAPTPLTPALAERRAAAVGTNKGSIIERPSTFSVLRLTTRSDLTGCSELGANTVQDLCNQACRLPYP